MFRPIFRVKIIEEVTILFSHLLFQRAFSQGRESGTANEDLEDSSSDSEGESDEDIEDSIKIEVWGEVDSVKGSSAPSESLV